MSERRDKHAGSRSRGRRPKAAVAVAESVLQAPDPPKQPAVRPIMPMTWDTGDRYIGPSTSRHAEWTVGSGDFRLYHLVPDAPADFLPVLLPLMIVYKTDFGQPHHYVVRKTPCDRCAAGGRAKPSADDRCTGAGRFYVETGPSMPPTFATLSALVAFYSTYAYMMPNERSELFPWWVMDKDEYVPRRGDPFPTAGEADGCCGSRTPLADPTKVTGRSPPLSHSYVEYE